MDSDSDEGGFITYAQVEQHFNSLSLDGPSAQERIDCIVPIIVSLLPAPYVPAPEVDSDSDSDDDDRFSFTSSDSEHGASDGHDALALPFAVPPADGEDRISRLPDTILGDIVHRLPTKDAGRTAALSTHWRRVWAGTALLVDDAHLRGAGETNDVPVVRALSRCVAAHPGPVRGARVTRVSFFAHEYALRRLVADLADKDVRDLVLVNRPWPLDMPLPDDILRCASLERLYLGVWKFPKTTAAHPPVFPELHELGLFHSLVRNEEFESLLAHCPKLEVLSLAMSYGSPSRLHLASDSLKIAVEWMCTYDEVVVHAPNLERLLFHSILGRRPVKIVHAPRLEVLGVLDLDLHGLEIGGTVIKAGMKVSASNMVPSLKILAVKVQFECNREAKILPTLLKCFPRLETLHIMPTPSETPDSPDDLRRFWEHLGPCECLESHLETVMLYGMLAEGNGGGFLRYIVREGKALKTIALVCCDGKVVSGSRQSADGGSGDIAFRPATPRWSFQAAIDLSLGDPFGVVMAQA